MAEISDPLPCHRLHLGDVEMKWFIYTANAKVDYEDLLHFKGELDFDQYG